SGTNGCSMVTIHMLKNTHAASPPVASASSPVGVAQELFPLRCMLWVRMAQAPHVAPSSTRTPDPHISGSSTTAVTADAPHASPRRAVRVPSFSADDHPLGTRVAEPRSSESHKAM